MNTLIKRIVFGTAIAVVAVPAVALAALRPQFQTQWALYTADEAKAPYRLYLDPFPDARSCDLDRRVVLHAGGFARCESHIVLSFDRAKRDQLFWEFESPGNPFLRLCGKIAAALR
jgi:hypothetical protein